MGKKERKREGGGYEDREEGRKEQKDIGKERRKDKKGENEMKKEIKRKRGLLCLHQPGVAELLDSVVWSWQPPSFRSDYLSKLERGNLSLVTKVNDPGELSKSKTPIEREGKKKKKAESSYSKCTVQRLI